MASYAERVQRMGRRIICHKCGMGGGTLVRVSEEDAEKVLYEHSHGKCPKRVRIIKPRR